MLARSTISAISSRVILLSSSGLHSLGDGAEMLLPRSIPEMAANATILAVKPENEPDIAHPFIYLVVPERLSK